MAAEETVTLKNGVAVSAVAVVLEVAGLRHMLANHPNGEQLVTDLHNYCSGRRDLVPPDRLAGLIQQRHIFPQATGQLDARHDLKQVLLAAYQLTPEGVVLVSPLQGTDHNREALARAEAEVQRRLNTLPRHLDDPDRGSDGRQ